MFSEPYQLLSEEAKDLVQWAVERLEPNYDKEVGAIVYRPRNTNRVRSFIAARPNLYYALGILLLNQEGCGEKAAKICNIVIDGQADTPNEIFHGTFNHTKERMPKSGAMDYKRLGVYGRYFTDLFYEKMANQFRLNLKADERFRDDALEIEHLLEQAVVSEFPVVWTTYEPNSREFVLMCYAMLLEHFATKLGPDCVRRLEHSAEIGMQGSIIRDMTDFSPLNTNVECMYVFIADYFGKRLNHPEYCQIALNRAEKMLAKYQEHHAVAEFNSPPYSSVDLGTLGFWQKYGSNTRLKEISKILEQGMWEDYAEFFNPAMMNLCGPYTRAYELRMGTQSSFSALLYLGLGKERFPLNEKLNHSDSPLTVLGGVHIPELAQKALFAPKEDVDIYHQFRELSERGEPGNNDALCTATGWITPDLMTGCLAGSENPSHQLHPLVVFWRGEKELGTIKVLRSTPEGKLNHLHTVYFNAKAEKNHLTMDVDFSVNRDVKLYFEIDYPGVCETAVITDNLWKLPGLTIEVKADAPHCFVETKCTGSHGSDPENVLKVCYLSEALKPETKKMHFDLLLTRNSTDAIE